MKRRIFMLQKSEGLAVAGQGESVHMLHHHLRLAARGADGPYGSLHHEKQTAAVGRPNRGGATPRAMCDLERAVGFQAFGEDLRLAIHLSRISNAETVGRPRRRRTFHWPGAGDGMKLTRLHGCRYGPGEKAADH